MSATPTVTPQTTVGEISVAHPLDTRVFPRHNMDS